MLEGIDVWIKSATPDQLKAKVAEYEKTQQSWNGRDNEMIHKLLVKLRLEIAKRSVDA